MIPPAAALFDFAGTLIDREPLIELAVVRACRAQGFEPADGSILIGRAWQDLHADLGVGPALGWTVADLVDRARAEAARRVRRGRSVRRSIASASACGRDASYSTPPSSTPMSVRSRGRSGATTGRPDAMYSNTFSGDQ